MATAARQIDVAGVAVQFCQSDRCSFPTQGGAGQAKLLGTYLAVAADALLGALRDRPTRLQRFRTGSKPRDLLKRVRKHPDICQICTG